MFSDTQKIGTMADIVNRSGFFEPSQVAIETHQSSYTIEKYLALLSSLSGYIELEPHQRNQLLTDVGKIFTRTLTTNHLNTAHWFAAQIAPLKSVESIK